MMKDKTRLSTPWELSLDSTQGVWSLIVFEMLFLQPCSMLRDLLMQEDSGLFVIVGQIEQRHHGGNQNMIDVFKGKICHIFLKERKE